MSNSQVRIQAYIDSHLSQLLHDYADVNKLTISKAVCSLLLDALTSSHQASTQSLVLDYVTRAEFEQLEAKFSLQLDGIDKAARLSYSNFDSQLREIALKSGSSNRNQTNDKVPKSQGFRPRS